MLEELKQGSKLVGAKQTRRALKDGRAKKLYMAKDADPRLLQPLVQEAVRTGVRVEQVDTMRELGEACGIAVARLNCEAIYSLSRQWLYISFNFISSESECENKASTSEKSRS